MDLEQQRQNGDDGVWYAAFLRRHRFRSRQHEREDCRRLLEQ